MKVFFKAIRQNDYDKVKEYLDKKPHLANCVAQAPPKKDDGLSPLQVAIKIGYLKIAELLIDRGADVNYIDKSDIHEWNMPVLHDCIRALVYYILEQPKKVYQSYIDLFKKLLSKDIDFDKLDSRGNDALDMLIEYTDFKYNCKHKVTVDDTAERDIILSEKDRKPLIEKRLREIYTIFLDEYLKNSVVRRDANDYRNTPVYERYQIDMFSVELLHSLLLKKQGQGLINF